MEEDLIARGTIPATLNWPLQPKYFFYTHGGTLNMEDGPFVTSDKIREAADSLNTGLKAIVNGTLKPNREKDKLTYALGTLEHTRCVRGIIVPWKHDFSVDIKTSKPMQKERAIGRKMSTLEERVASIEDAIAVSQQQ